MALPGALLNWLELRFFLEDGTPNVGGKIQFYETGTSTPKDTYVVADLTPGTENTNPLILDANGRPETGGVFLATGGYDALVYDQNDVLLYSVVGFEDSAGTFFGTLGLFLATGSSAVVSGYTVLPTDQFITVATTGGASPAVINLPPASERGQPLTIKNIGNIAIAVTPNGSDQIDFVAGPFAIPLAASPLFPSAIFLSDGNSSWLVMASHGL